MPTPDADGSADDGIGLAECRLAASRLLASRLPRSQRRYPSRKRKKRIAAVELRFSPAIVSAAVPSSRAAV